MSLAAPGKPGLEVALPSDFQNEVADAWSPEELLIASLATCFELTMVALAEHRQIPLHSLRVDATGYVDRKRHLYRLALLELDVRAGTNPGREEDVKRLAAIAHEGCLVGIALDVPVRLEIEASVLASADAAASS